MSSSTITKVSVTYKSVHWFLYDRGLRHERVKLFLEAILILLKYIKTKSQIIYFLKRKTNCCLVKQKRGIQQTKYP